MLPEIEFKKQPLIGLVFFVFWSCFLCSFDDSAARPFQ